MENMVKRKTVPVAFLILMVILSLSGCKKVPQTDSNTALGQAYNAINKAGKKIKGFSKECISYYAMDDKLQLYARPGLDYVALIEVLNEAVGANEANTIGLCRGEDEKTGKGYPVEELLEAYSLHATGQVKRLVLDAPEGSGNGKVEQPKLWRDSLERLEHVAEVQFSEPRMDTNNINYLRDIAEDGKINAPFDTVVVSVSTDQYSYFDLSGTEAFSGLKRLVLGADMDRGFRVKGLEHLDPAQTQIDLTYFSGNLDAAKFAYMFRAQGFTVEGISEDPRDDLNQGDTETYDSFVADQEALTAFRTEEMPFSERLEQYLEISTHFTGIDMTEPGILLLQSFYSLAGTDEFISAIERMCSYDEWLQAQQTHYVDARMIEPGEMHEYILARICLNLIGKDDFERFLTDVVDMLPEDGSWCKATVRVTDSEGNEKEKTALDALMQGYEALRPAANKKTMSGEQEAELLDRIEGRGLLSGYHNSKYFTGNAEQDIATAGQLLDEGKVSYEDAYGMMINAAGDAIDSFLKATVLWDAAYDKAIVRKVRSGSGLSVSDDRLNRERFIQPDSSIAFSGKANGRKAVFAYEAKDVDELIFPQDAYRWFTDDNGELFRAVPPQNTPESVDDAELLIIAWISGYQYAGDYSDGTKGYRCISDAYAYDIATGECVKHLGTVYTEPPESLAAAEKYDVYPGPDLLTLYKIAGSWMIEE